MRLNPIKFGLYGGLSFALVQTLLHYVIDKRFSFSGIFGGLVWFLTSIFLYKFMQKKE